MELIVKDTYIFSTSIFSEIEKIIKNYNFNTDKDFCYNLVISFDMQQYKDKRIVDFYNQYIKKETNEKKIIKNKKANSDIDNLLSYIANKVVTIFTDNNINIYICNIQGNNLVEKNDVELFFQECDYKYNGYKVTSISTNHPYIEDKLSDLLNENLYKLFDNAFHLYGYKAMSQILKMTETKDKNKLYTTFANQYYKLFKFGREGEKNELYISFTNRCIEVWNKYYAGDGEKYFYNNAENKYINEAGEKQDLNNIFIKMSQMKESNFK